jgi:hypothetical protein
MIGWGHGHGVIMDKHYRMVQSVEPSGTYQASSDMHEFMLINNGKSALMTQYIRSVYDLCIEPWNLCDGLGYIQSGVFQEVHVDTGKVIFQWNSLDHVDPHESWVPPSSTEISGSGEHPTSPWDYFHINSIDKNDQGDYLISARHTSAIYKISGKDGSVMWRLNGFKSDFAMLDGLNFSSQHDARFVSDNSSMTVLSVYDNASNGFNYTKPYSQGLVIAIDHETNEARAIKVQDPPPNALHSSRSQGSFQFLPDGNTLMGYGNDAFFSEHDSNGSVVFYGRLAITGMMNYRVHKYNNWIGEPLTKPAVWSYSKYGYTNSTQEMKTHVQDQGYNFDDDANGMVIYISWNGATEVKSWRILAATSHEATTSVPQTWPEPPIPAPPTTDQAADWTELSMVPKNGFETFYKHPQAYRYIYIQALDKDDNVLGTSAVQETFVPNEKMRDRYCDGLACFFMPSAEERERIKQQEEQGKNESDSQLSEQPIYPVTYVATETRSRIRTISGSFIVGFILVVALVLGSRWVVARKFAGRQLSPAALIVKVRDVLSGRRGAGRSVSYKALNLDEVLDEGEGEMTGYDDDRRSGIR